MFRNTAFASLVVLTAVSALSSAAPAQNGSAITGYVAPDLGNVVGGGGATLFGGGNDMVILYSRGGAGGGASLAQAGRLARFGGGTGDGPEVEYPDLAPAGAGHSRAARLVGGGDNAEVVYEPRGAR